MANWRARRAGNRDKNHAEIAEGLKNLGVSVADTSIVGWGFTDMVCGYKGKNFLFEIKLPGEGLNDREDQFFVEWQGQRDVVRTAEEAWKIILDNT